MAGGINGIPGSELEDFTLGPAPRVGERSSDSKYWEDELDSSDPTIAAEAARRVFGGNGEYTSDVIQTRTTGRTSP